MTQILTSSSRVQTRAFSLASSTWFSISPRSSGSTVKHVYLPKKSLPLTSPKMDIPTRNMLAKWSSTVESVFRMRAEFQFYPVLAV